MHFGDLGLFAFVGGDDGTNLIALGFGEFEVVIEIGHFKFWRCRIGARGGNRRAGGFLFGRVMSGSGGRGGVGVDGGAMDGGHGLDLCGAEIIKRSILLPVNFLEKVDWVIRVVVECSGKWRERCWGSAIRPGVWLVKNRLRGRGCTAHGVCVS